MTTELEQFLDAEISTVAHDQGEVQYEELRRLWARWFPEETPQSVTGWEVFADVVESGLRTAEARDTLEFRPGGWTIKLGRGATRTALAAALIAGALAVGGVTGIPAAVLPAVLPLFFDIDRVRLTKGQEYILAELRLQPDVRDGGVSADELYERLPDETKRELSKADFFDFLETCRRAGVADSSGSNFALRSPSEAKFRITII